MLATIWSKYNCSYCDRAKALLKARNIPFEEKKIGDGYTKEELLEAVPDARSVPQIFLGEKYIGGYDQLAKYIDETGFNGTGHSIGT
jgi:glutaredoxin 3